MSMMTVINRPKHSVGRHVRSNKFRQFFGHAFVQIVLILVVFIWTLPTVGLLISSFRTPEAIRTTGWWTALQTPFNITQWTLENYNYVLTSDRMGAAFLNSLLVSVPATVIPITMAAFAAYAFAWMKFPGRDFLFSIVVGLMVVPLQMAFIPILRIYSNLGLNGSFLGIWLAHTGFGLPLAVFLLHSYIAGLPHELIEAASIDGASHFTTFTRLVLPLSVPAIASFAVFQFLWVWNDLLVALVFLGTGPDVTIVTSRLSEMVGSRGQDWHVLTAGAFISMALPILVFFALQRYFVRGLLAGSIKG